MKELIDIFFLLTTNVVRWYTHSLYAGRKTFRNDCLHIFRIIVHMHICQYWILEVTLIGNYIDNVVIDIYIYIRVLNNKKTQLKRLFHFNFRQVTPIGSDCMQNVFLAVKKCLQTESVHLLTFRIDYTKAFPLQSRTTKK